MKPRKKSRRQRLEQAIEKAIELLDQIDGDPDLEPSLAFTDARMGLPGVQLGYDLEIEFRNRPPKGYMHPGDLCGPLGVGHYRLKP
jgi:hypothetical protein